MSEEGSFGLSMMEKLFGFVILVAGFIFIYYTATSTQVLGAYAVFFGFLSVILMVIGLVLMIAKTQE